MICSNCGATMEEDPANDGYVCPYCGNTTKIQRSDEVAVEKIKSDSYKEVELEKMKNQNQYLEQTNKDRNIRHFKHTVGILLILFMLVSAFFFLLCMISIHPSKIILMVITGIQFGLFLMSYLMGSGHTKESSDFNHIHTMVLGLILIIPFFMFFK